MFPPGLEPGTFRVLGERDKRYTTETCDGSKFHQFQAATHYLEIKRLIFSLKT